MKVKSVLMILLVSGIILSPLSAVAQNGNLSLTVVPPIFTPNLNPGETWRSMIKVVNSNPYDLTVSLSVVNFTTDNEEGHARFVPVIEDDKKSSSLINWITLGEKEITIPRESSREIPVSVSVPVNAEPGGHYAAVLVGNKSSEGTQSGSKILISGMVSALFFVRVSGEVNESGFIREFFTSKKMYEEPDAEFVLRFENSGNVHLKPQGEIKIYNMWGKERGRIQINQRTNFGNVLPKSIRRFVFQWKGESNFFDIGKYKAVAALTFGAGSKQNAVSETTFWILPLKPMVGVAGGALFVILILSWSVRLYIRRALSIEAQRSGGIYRYPGDRRQKRIKDRLRSFFHTMTEPVYEGLSDLKSGKNKDHGSFLRRNRKAVLAVSLIALCVYLIVIFLVNVLSTERKFEIYVREEEGQLMQLQNN